MDPPSLSEKEVRLRWIKDDLRRRHQERLEGLKLLDADQEDDVTVGRYSKYRRDKDRDRDRSEREIGAGIGRQEVSDRIGRREARDRDRIGREEARERNAGSTCHVPNPLEDEEFKPKLPSSPSPSKQQQQCAVEIFPPIEPESEVSAVPIPIPIPAVRRTTKVVEPAAIAMTNVESTPAPAPTKTEKKIPSILKKKLTPVSSGGPSVSFDLDDLGSSSQTLQRTKSSESNLSNDSETGYWSGDQSVSGSGGGILKKNRSRSEPLDAPSTDYKSILRRSSLGSAPNEHLQSILVKRKLSHDSSVTLASSSHGGSGVSWASPEPPFCSSSGGGILKKKSYEDLEDEDTPGPTHPRPILKRVDTPEMHAMPHEDAHNVPAKSILKKPSASLSSSGERSSRDDDSSSSSGGCSLWRRRDSEPTRVRPEQNLSDELNDLMDSNSPLHSKKKRFATQPVTNIEVQAAIARGNCSTQTENDGGDLPKLSISDRVRLFNGLSVKGPLPHFEIEKMVERAVRPRRLTIQPIITVTQHENGDCSPNPDFAESGQNSEGQKESSSQSTGEEQEERSPMTPIAEKIAALSSSAEWKKKVDQNGNLSELKQEPIHARLSLLEKSQSEWKKRVGETDAEKFTVQGKLAMAGKKLEKESGAQIHSRRKIPIPDDSAIVAVVAAEPPQTVLQIHFKTTENLLKKPTATTVQSPEPEPESKVKTEADMVLKIRQRIPIAAPRKIRPILSSNSKESVESNKTGTATTPVLKTLPSKSFKTSGIANATDLDIIPPSREEELLGLRRNLRPNRNHRSVNPVKSLAARSDLEEYSVEKGNAKKTNALPMSASALAGLASKVDFTAVKLKKPEVVIKGWPHPMLIRIKGRRFVQMRLVEPKVTSLSSGDCYLLVTNGKVFQYIGQFANRMERSKSAEVSSAIMRKRDLGSGPDPKIVTIEEPTEGRAVLEFYNLLGGGTKPEDENSTLGDYDDEEYELSAIRDNKFYRVGGDGLQLLTASGSQPKYSMLEADGIFLFDFNTELYLWSGSRADPTLKNLGYQYAKEMFSGRPEWSLLKKINQHMEPVLFVEKFGEWPWSEKLKSGSGQSSRNASGSDRTDSGTGSSPWPFAYPPCRVEDMLEAWKDGRSPTLMVEGVDVNAIDQSLNITTTSLKSWHISEFAKSSQESEFYMHFYSTETYVIRWQYRVHRVCRDLKGNESKHGKIALGRERTTYFFWHGKDSKLTEQGASALMTVELDEERGKQIRVEQGYEPAAFLRLFNGIMFIHNNMGESGSEFELYVVMGPEGHVIQVPAEAESFRSRGSFILLDKRKNKSKGKDGDLVYVWYGALSSDKAKKISCATAVHLSSCWVELNEGEETSVFLECIQISKTEVEEWRESYSSSLLLEQSSNVKEIQLFQFSTLSGTFTTTPVILRRKDDDFPILQQDLYGATQPALFLVNTGVETWLWQGNPNSGNSGAESVAGSSSIRHAAERKAAVETLFNFSQHEGTSGFVITSGYEPPAFKALFPYWVVQVQPSSPFDSAPNSPSAEQPASPPGAIPTSMAIPVQSALEKLTRKSFTLEELKEKPEGVDMGKLENYLCDEEFENLLQMTRSEFCRLQSWKQTELKKAVGLF